MFQNTDVDITFSVHDTFLESSSLGMPKAEIFESHFISFKNNQTNIIEQIICVIPVNQFKSTCVDMDKMIHWVVEMVHRTPLHSITVCSLVMDRVSLSAGFGLSVYNSERHRDHNGKRVQGVRSCQHENTSNVDFEKRGTLKPLKC